MLNDQSYTQAALKKLATPQVDEQREDLLARRKALEGIARPEMATLGQATGAQRLASSRGFQTRAMQAGEAAGALEQQTAAKRIQQAGQTAALETQARGVAQEEAFQPQTIALAKQKQALGQQQAEMEFGNKEAQIASSERKARLAWQEVAQNQNSQVREIAYGIKELSVKQDQALQALIQNKKDFDQGIIDKTEAMKRQGEYQQQLAKLEGDWKVKEANLAAGQARELGNIDIAAMKDLTNYFNKEKENAANKSMFGLIGGGIGAIAGTFIEPGAGTVAGWGVGSGLGQAYGSATYSGN